MGDAIIQRVPWRVQPQVAAGADRANSLTKGLLIAAIPANNPSTVGSVTRKPGIAGVGWSGFSTANYLTFTPPALTAGTVMLVAQNISISSIDTPTKTGGPTGNGDIIPFTNGLIYWGGLASDRYISAAAIPTGVDLLKPWVAIGVGSTTSTTHGLYLNNKLVGGALVNATFSSTATWKIGADDNFSYSGSIFAFAAWNRILSAPEIASVSANPWQLFAPLSRRIWAPSAAGGVGPLVFGGHLINQGPLVGGRLALA